MSLLHSRRLLEPNGGQDRTGWGCFRIRARSTAERRLAVEEGRAAFGETDGGRAMSLKLSRVSSFPTRGFISPEWEKLFFSSRVGQFDPSGKKKEKGYLMGIRVPSVGIRNV